MKLPAELSLDATGADLGRTCSGCLCWPCTCHRPPEPTVAIELTEEELAGMLDPPANAHVWVQRVRPKIQSALAKLRGER